MLWYDVHGKCCLSFFIMFIYFLPEYLVCSYILCSLKWFLHKVQQDARGSIQIISRHTITCKSTLWFLHTFEHFLPVSALVCRRQRLILFKAGWNDFTESFKSSNVTFCINSTQHSHSQEDDYLRRRCCAACATCWHITGWLILKICILLHKTLPKRFFRNLNFPSIKKKERNLKENIIWLFNIRQKFDVPNLPNDILGITHLHI